MSISAIHRLKWFTRLASPALATLGFVAAMVLMPGLRALWLPIDLPVHFDPFVLVAVAVLLLLAIHAEGPFRLLTVPPLQRLGLWSFGLYLFHVPVLSLITHTVPNEKLDDGYPFMLALILSLSVAAFLNWAIERPAMAMLRRPRREGPTSVFLAQRQANR